jgi:hypothetical protein
LGQGEDGGTGGCGSLCAKNPWDGRAESNEKAEGIELRDSAFEETQAFEIAGAR